jgi:SAM-dependent methyltransferase
VEAKHDVFGRELMAHYLGQPVTQVVERDDGYIDASTTMADYFLEYKDWPAFQKKAMKHVRGRVLDIGCGAGRHALYLQKKGHKVVGLDNSPLALKVCRKRGLKQTCLAPVTRIPARLGSFDTLLMMGHNFGLLENHRRAKWLLKRFWSLTGEDGRIIAETLDYSMTKLPVHVNYQRRNRARGRTAGQIRLRLRFQEYGTPWFDYLFVTPAEMKRIVKGTGWKVTRIIESEALDYVAVLEKERS